MARSTRVAAVDAVVDRHRHPPEGAAVVEPEGRVRRGQHPGGGCLRDGDVGPPVDGHVVGGDVGDGDVDREVRRAVGQPGVDLHHQLPHPLVLPQPQPGGAVGQGDPGGVQRLAGQRVVTGGAEVPLHPAGEPGVPQGEVARLQRVVGVQQLAAGDEVDQRPQPSALAQQEGGPQPVVAEHGDRVGDVDERPVVVVLRQIGQHRRDAPVREVGRHLLVDRPGALGGVRRGGVQIGGRSQRGQRAGSDPCGRQGEGGQLESGHDNRCTRRTVWQDRERSQPRKARWPSSRTSRTGPSSRRTRTPRRASSSPRRCSGSAAGWARIRPGRPSWPTPSWR